MNYRLVLEATEPERILYLAVPVEAYESFFYRDLPKASMKKSQIKLMIYDSINEVIKKEKIWIQRNQTDTLIADKLMDRGVAKEDIILGLQPPYIRQYTEFGVS